MNQLLIGQDRRAPAVGRRAPLRHHGQRRHPGHVRGVLPPWNGGLHCGVVVASIGPACRPSVPAGQRRAPLPPGGHAADVQAVRLFLPVTGRLHCVGWVARLLDGGGRLFPPVSGGLHCGTTSALEW